MKMAIATQIMIWAIDGKHSIWIDDDNNNDIHHDKKTWTIVVVAITFDNNGGDDAAAPPDNTIIATCKTVPSPSIAQSFSSRIQSSLII